MNYGYVRVRQNIINQDECIQKHTELLQEYGVEKTIVETDGSQLGELLATLKPNDALHVVSIDRLSRSIQRIRELADYFKDNNITLYAGNRPVDLNMQLLMFQIAQTPAHYEDEYEEEEEEEEEEDAPDLTDLCFRILECKTSHAASKIIDAFPEDRLKDLTMFLYNQYYNLKQELEELE